MSFNHERPVAQQLEVVGSQSLQTFRISVEVLLARFCRGIAREAILRVQPLLRLRRITRRVSQPGQLDHGN